MVIKCIYRKNLKMSPGKLAAQVGHVVANLTKITDNAPVKIVVLEASDKKFNEKALDLEGTVHYIQADAGFTEVAPGIETVLGWIES